MPGFMKEASKMINEAFSKKSGKTPICPFCEKNIPIENFVDGKGNVDQRADYAVGSTVAVTTMFICPHCSKVISISRGFYHK